MQETTEQRQARYSRLDKLREPFKPENVAHLPKVWCKACRDAATKVCPSHRKIKCETCGNSMTNAHTDIDYVGHAEVTNRLLEIDPEWTWEPLAVDESGLPKLDEHKGLWIKLTVCGVTRLGYGSAAWPKFKDPGDILKEIIGDALRNSAQRFGVALDLWAKTDLRADRAELEADTLSEPVVASAAPQDAQKPAYLGHAERQMIDDLFARVGLTVKQEQMFVASILAARRIDSLAEVKADEGIAILKGLGRAANAEEPGIVLAETLATCKQPTTDGELVTTLDRKIATSSDMRVLAAVVEEIRDGLARFKFAWDDYCILMTAARKRQGDLRAKK